jgi:hypothetical protein
MRSVLVASLVFALVACGDDGGTNGMIDAPANVPMMITVTGTASSVGIGGRSPEADVTVAAYANSDENTVVAMTTTNAQGNYTLTITTDGQALDGYLKATKANFKETYLYPPDPLSADFAGASINMVTSGTYGALYSFSQVSQIAGMATIAMIVSDGTNPVMGATVSSSPAGTYRYNGSNGLPANMANAMTTNTDGIGYILNVAPGQVTVSGSKSGSTFRSHAVKARPDQLTTTLVIP